MSEDCVTLYTFSGIGKFQKKKLKEKRMLDKIFKDCLSDELHVHGSRGSP